MCLSVCVCVRVETVHTLLCVRTYFRVYVRHRWKDFSGITVEQEEERGGNCILITVLMVVCSTRWRVLPDISTK